MCKAFYYKKYDFNYDTGVLTLSYQVNHHQFDETITFPGAPFVLDSKKKLALNDIFFLTHIAFGISYYKAFLSPKIVIENGNLTKEQARFFNTFYLNGLGEFSVRNNVTLDISFPYDEYTTSQTHDISLSDKVFVPVGGGKDSCVTIELLKSCNIQAGAFSVGNPNPILECVQKSGLDHLILRRALSAELLKLNEIGQVYNGHVPITGLIAFLLWCSSVLYDYRYIAMSCERSANSPNMILNGQKINHQYSKSFDFEQDFYHLTKSITPNFRYFSLLRPLSEMHIAKLFAEYCHAYFDVFTSCNKAFKLDESKRLTHWCGNCDKCRFVFLILAPFMDKQTLLNAVGTNPLNDETQQKGYEELLGLSGHKPFECVGELNECRYALSLLAKKSEWSQDKIVSKLSQKIYQLQEDILTPSTNHLIPNRFQDVLEKFKQ